MFDVGFWEMLLLLALGLLILGPKKLPAIALKIGNYISKARTLVNSFSRQMRQEIELEPKRPMVPKKTKPPLIKRNPIRKKNPPKKTNQKIRKRNNRHWAWGQCAIAFSGEQMFFSA